MRFRRASVLDNKFHEEKQFHQVCKLLRFGLNSFYGIIDSIQLHGLFNSNHYLSHPASRLWMRIMDFRPIYERMYLLWTDWLMESAYRHGNLRKNNKWHFKIGEGIKENSRSQKYRHENISESCKTLSPIIKTFFPSS